MERSLHSSTRAALHAAVVWLLLSPMAFASDLPELDCLVEPFQIIDVGSTHGIVESVAVDRSDAVEADDVLVTLDASEQSAAVRQAQARARMSGDLKAREAAVAFAERKQQRIRELFASEAISSHQRDEVETELELARMELRQAREARDLARLELERARIALENRTIRSPVAGIVVERYVAPGEFVNDTPLLRVAQMHPLRVEAIAPAEFFGDIRPGMVAEVITEVSGGTPLTAHITVVDRLIDPASGTFGIRLEMPNEDYSIPSGLHCRLKLSAAAPPADPPAHAVNTGTVAAVSAGNEEPAACVSLGPLERGSAVDALTAKLTGAGLSVTERGGPVDEVVGYFASTAQLGSAAEARQAAKLLRSQGIDDVAILTRPPYGYRVSLGLYTRRATAERRRAQIDRLGLGVATEVVPRTAPKPGIWLNLSGSPQRLAAQPWEPLATGVATSDCNTDRYVADTQALPR